MRNSEGIVEVWVLEKDGEDFTKYVKSKKRFNLVEKQDNPNTVANGSGTGSGIAPDQRPTTPPRRQRRFRVEDLNDAVESATEWYDPLKWI